VLFKEVFTNFVIKNIIARSNDQLKMIDADSAIDAENGLETLHRFARQSFNFMLERENVETFRLFVAERNRFPDLQDHIQKMVQGIEDVIMRHIRRVQNAGLIRPDVDHDIARSFMALINEGPLVRALLELPSLSTAERRDIYFNAAWSAFINAVAVRPS
jgi:AcrR family transcriptional regulator